MLVICEDCAKKYNIDESKIRGNRARFTCNECGHIIIVDKSDLSRPLVHATESEQQDQSSSSEPTIDLLKEMEAPLFSESTPSEQSSDSTDDAAAEGEQSDAAVTITGKRGLPIPGYFLLGGIASFIFTSAGFAYILFQYSSVIATQNEEFQFDMLITAVLVLVVTWALSFVALYSLGHVLSKSVNNMVAAIHSINMGERNVTISDKGPREITDLAHLITEMAGKLR